MPEPSAVKEPNEITFYRASEKPYGAFSNLFRRAIIFEHREFPSAEHAYQAGKARKKEVRDWILRAPTPALVAMAAHGLYTWDVVPNWTQIKYDRMRQVLRAKFSQHPDLRHLLLSTGEANLVEVGTVNNAVNRIWGRVNGRGQNMLGVLLMEVRHELRENGHAGLGERTDAINNCATGDAWIKSSSRPHANGQLKERKYEGLSLRRRIRDARRDIPPCAHSEY